ncbi:MAG: amidohydrolase family protein [Gemmataceae bacterium]|nr:amidohydrolase family protein [Gemmataceae bacterium]
MAMWTLTARWIFPADAPPMRGGSVTIDGERIVAVGPRAGQGNLDLGDSAVLPGLVNAHTHLDLTGMRGLAPPSPDFTGWLRQVIAHRRSRTPEQVCEDIRAGLAECIRFGTTLVGDISGDGSSWNLLKDAPLRAVVFRELLGPTKERADSALAAAEAWLNANPATPTCRPGLSPHAPYSCRADLIGLSKCLAEKHQAPVAVHLAESAEEMEFMRHRRGPFLAFLDSVGAWESDTLPRSPVQVRDAATWQLPIPQLFIHGNYLTPRFALRPQDTLVYCPRTHAAFGHPPHPFRDFLARGKRVALGTDSLASNPDLDLLAEVRLLHRLYPDLPGADLLRMATLSGAEALGWASVTGSLTPGKSADLIVVPLSARNHADPHALVLDSDEPVRAVLWRGRWVYGGRGV